MDAINWNDVEAQENEFENPTASGYVMKIVNAVDVPEKKYVLVTLDICEGKFSGRGADIEKRLGKDWGYYKSYRSYKESAKGFFRAFLDALEKSNKRFSIADFKNQPSNLIGLTIGVVLGEEEYVGKDENGSPKKKTRLVVAKTLSADDVRVGKYKVPALKMLSESDKLKLQESYVPFSNASVPVGDFEAPF